MSALDSWLLARGTSLLEVLGVLTGVANVGLTVRQRLLAWPIGIINALLYFIIFARAGLYSDTGLQLVYACLSAYGWWHWARGGPSFDALPVTRVSGRQVAITAVAALLVWMVLTQLTTRLAGAQMPRVDAALVAGSLSAQWWMTRKRLECWPLWMVVNVGYVALFATRGLLLTALLYIIYVILPIFGLREWTAAWKRSTSPVSASS
jgi:nicotinamide mononucleotide transporter